jgi:hypothetical protein
MGNIACWRQQWLPVSGFRRINIRIRRLFFLLEGRPEFALWEGAELAWKTAAPGDMVKIPVGTVHGFRNESGGVVRLLIMCTAGLGRFFEEAGMPLAEGEAAGADLSLTTIQHVVGIAEKHGQRFPVPA